jgi:hypothetical protein
MTPMEQQIENPRCSACGDEMELTVLIPLFGGSAYGLKFLPARSVDARKTISLHRPRRPPKAFCCAQGWEERACIH